MKSLGPARYYWRRIIGILSLLVAVSACAGLGQSIIPDRDQPEYFQPPTVAVINPVVLSTPTQAIPATPTPILIPTPSCSNNLTYLEDLTIPDGTVVGPGESMDKRWLVSNSGTCNWDDRYRLKRIAGSDLGLAAEQSLFPARSGTDASIRFLFIAPDEPGAQRSAWQAYSPEGDSFGDPIFIDIVVQPSAGAP